ncbi:MAG: hypothetical protein HY526_10150 [Betaproteobacteria bacterium]|nr:hypothetical protein [Betaproteobacteria bacterium]
MIVFYTVAIILIISGRYAWTHCEWDWVSRVSAIGVILGIIIERWNVLLGKPVAAATRPAERLPILLLCLGTFIAGFGELLGKLAFGCR